MLGTTELSPPVGLHVNAAGQWVDTVGVALALVVIAVAAVRLHRRTHSWFPVVIPLGALVAGFMEPIYTVATNLWYMKPGQVSLLSSFGTHLPVWVLFSYCACYGGLGLLVWWMVHRGAGRKQLWVTLFGFWIGFILLEIVNLALGTYTYYGVQPFKIASFPAWVSLTNAAICIAIGVLATLAERVLERSAQWLFVAAGPAIVAAGLFGTTFPEDVALHVPGPNVPLAYGAALASMLLAASIAALILQLIPQRGLLHEASSNAKIQMPGIPYVVPPAEREASSSRN